jgi:Na+/H+ antiporter NhaD/arsenite permease-like protein
MSVMNKSLLALTFFLLAYILFIFFPKRRTLVAMTSSAGLLLLGVLSLPETFSVINWNVMGIFFGTLVVADIFMESRVPAFLAEKIAFHAPSTAWAILAICALAGFISAFVENVATVLIVAPIALALARKLKINPTQMMIAIAVSSNLQGTATLIGDPPSMLLGGFAKMNFGDFFVYKGRPSIFFAVELGALASFVVLYFLFRSNTKKLELVCHEKIRSWIPTILLILLIVLLALSSLWDTGFSYIAGLLCMIFAGLSFAWEKIANKGSLVKGLKKLDWDTTFFLMGIFVLVGAVTLTGWIDQFSQLLSSIIGNNILLGYVLIIVVSVVLSAFIDNVPFLAAMLPVALSVSQNLNIHPELFLFGLLIGASLGGNITPIGASANVVVCGLLKKEGYTVSFKEFFKVGFPFTVAAVLAASIFVWIVWGA